MAQPRIPAARGAAAGLQAQNGAASASGSPYTNGECRTGAGRTARLGPGDESLTAWPREPWWTYMHLQIRAGGTVSYVFIGSACKQ